MCLVASIACVESAGAGLISITLESLVWPSIILTLNEACSRVAIAASFLILMVSALQQDHVAGI